MVNCIHCLESKPQLYKCSGCDTAIYCSKECQTSSWATHSLICSSVKRRKTSELPVGLDLLRRIIQENVQDAVIHIARMLTRKDVYNILVSGNGDFLRQSRLFWYARIQLNYPTYNLGGYDPSIDYWSLIPGILASESTTHEHYGQHLFEHPQYGIIAVSPFDSLEYDGTHLTMIDAHIYLPPNEYYKKQDLIDIYTDVINRLKSKRKTRISYANYIRAGLYLVQEDIKWLFEYMYQKGFILKKRPRE